MNTYIQDSVRDFVQASQHSNVRSCLIVSRSQSAEVLPLLTAVGWGREYTLLTYAETSEEQQRRVAYLEQIESTQPVLLLCDADEYEAGNYQAVVERVYRLEEEK